MPSHIQLRRRYLYFNRKYFDNELPKDVEILWHPVQLKWNAFTVKNADGRFTIKIDPMLQTLRNYTDIVLLHEMTHIHNMRAIHGKVFDTGIDRLYEAGAYKGLL